MDRPEFRARLKEAVDLSRNALVRGESWCAVSYSLTVGCFAERPTEALPELGPAGAESSGGNSRSEASGSVQGQSTNGQTLPAGARPHRADPPGDSIECRELVPQPFPLDDDWFPSTRPHPLLASPARMQIPQARRYPFLKGRC